LTNFPVCKIFAQNFVVSGLNEMRPNLIETKVFLNKDLKTLKTP
jgi:hypothetical protein